jgi:hypothetical protein
MAEAGQGQLFAGQSESTSPLSRHGSVLPQFSWAERGARSSGAGRLYTAADQL